MPPLVTIAQSILGMSNTTTSNIDALHYDAHNFNSHTEQGRALLKKSVTENGFGRSIVVDKDNNIIAGNGIVEAAKALNKRNIRVIDTTGDELVVVRRTDLDIDSEEGRRLALADNATSSVNLAWNYDELEKAREAWNVKPDDWGVKIESEEYRKFVEKFDKDAEKTTDDCYTPQDVYECVRDYFIEEGVIPKGAKIVRPFYPGGDYEKESYPDGCVVYDNPPFSILTEIVKYYQDNGIKFLLYCQTLSSLHLAQYCTFIVLNFRLNYANGAVVNTSFLTNLLPDDISVMTLRRDLKERLYSLASQPDKVGVTPRNYPPGWLTVKALARISENDVQMTWYRDKMQYIRGKDVCEGVQVFGGYFINSAGQTEAQNKALILAEENRRNKVVQIELSADELEIVNELSKNDE